MKQLVRNAKEWRRARPEGSPRTDPRSWTELTLKPTLPLGQQIWGTSKFFTGGSTVSFSLLTAVSHLTDTSLKKLLSFTIAEENENEQNHRKVGNLLLT